MPCICAITGEDRNSLHNWSTRIVAVQVVSLHLISSARQSGSNTDERRQIGPAERKSLPSPRTLILTGEPSHFGTTILLKLQETSGRTHVRCRLEMSTSGTVCSGEFRHYFHALSSLSWRIFVREGSMLEMMKNQQNRLHLLKIVVDAFNNLMNTIGTA